MKITEIFDDDADLDLTIPMMDMDNASTNSARSSSRLRHRKSGGKHGPSNSNPKCYEKNCCCSSGDGQTPKNAKKSKQTSSTTQKKNKKINSAILKEGLEDDNASIGTNSTNSDTINNYSETFSNTSESGSISAKQLRTRRIDAMEEEASEVAKNNFEDILFPQEEERENRREKLITLIVHLIKFDWKNPRLMVLIHWNFPNFRIAHPEMLVNLYLLMFLNICAGIRNEEINNIDKKNKQMMELGKEVKEMLREIGENMEAKKLQKLSRKVNSTLDLIYCSNVEKVNGHSLLKNHKQTAEKVGTALKAEMTNNNNK